MEKMGFSERGEKAAGEEYNYVKSKVRDALKDYFRPEFLNRLDAIIVFDILSMEAIKEIVKIQVDIVRERLTEKEIEIVVKEDALEYLAKEGYNPQYGARPLKRLIQNKILNPIASLIISKGILKGGSIMSQ
jgi:ATP-dependent Clp protease ATP-binding subunit ClpA